MERLQTTKFNYMKKSKGLGDTIEKLTKATGIKKVVDTVSKVVEKDCGCNKRKDSLNRLFPYKDTKDANKVYENKSLIKSLGSSKFGYLKAQK
tara:strand:- start:6078 stop:6356 length:279 start_codon:yes stop_codon:yes gene_type:complete